LTVLDAALQQAVEGTGAVVMIGAEAGMRKSRLVAELGAVATAQCATIVIGECLPFGDGELPYAPIVSACDRSCEIVAWRTSGVWQGE
jgi:predicted ATPase